MRASRSAAPAWSSSSRARSDGEVGGGELVEARLQRVHAGGTGLELVEPGDAGGDLLAQRLEVGQPAAQGVDLAAQRGQLGDAACSAASSARNASRSPAPAWRASSCVRRVASSAAPSRSAATSVRSSLTSPASRRAAISARSASSSRSGDALLAQGVDAGAGGLGVAGQVVEPAAVLARLGALDGDGGELLAQGVGLALDVLDALERGGELGAGGLGLAGAVALDPLERGGQLGAGGLGGLLVLGADLLELADELGLADLAGAGAALLDLGQAHLDGGAGLLGAAAGLGDGLLGGALGLGDGGREAGVGGGRGLGALALQAVEAAGQLGAGGLGDVERAAAVVRGLLGVEAGALEALEAGEQLVVLGVVDATAAARQRALHLGAQGLGLALGGLGAALGALAGLLELAGQAERDALELVDPLHRRQQARHHGGRVVEVGDRVALDAGIEVGQALLDLGVGLGAHGLAARELGLDPRRGLERAEDDERAGRAPALPGLGLGLERLAHRAHDDRVLRAHALQHEVHRQLEAEVLEEEREVEALVELDGDEDGLHREVVALGDQAGDLDAAGGGRGLAGLQEAAPALGLGGTRDP